MRTYTCSVCGDSYTEEIAPTDHANTHIEGVCDATCTQEGYTGDTVCDDCGWIVAHGDVIDATGHSYEVTVTDPTCTENGAKVYTCHCGDTYTEVIPAIGHDYASAVTEPTCTEKGYTTHICNNCGATYTSDHVDALGHKHEAVVTAPTCREGGYTTYTCTICGDSYVADHTEAIGHNWDEGVVTKEPTVEAEGEKTYTCTTCGETSVEILPKKPDVHYDVPADDSVTIPENDCFEDGTTVTVEKIENGETKETVDAAMKDVAQKYVAFEFTASKAGEAVQPEGALQVIFAIPEGYSTNIALYYLTDSGKLEKLVVVVDAESRTVSVALTHFSTYILVDQDTASEYVLGDVNGDGRINARDARALLRYLAGLDDADMIDTVAADYNSDGRINARDARAILRFVAGLD